MQKMRLDRLGPTGIAWCSHDAVLNVLQNAGGATMHRTQRSRLLGSEIMLVVGCMLALAACNSGSGSSQKATGSTTTVTGAESPAPTKAPGKGTIAEVLAEKLKGTQ
jgi:hypothetical protein